MLKTRIPQKKEPQQKKPVDLELLESAFMVWVLNGMGPPIQATIEVLGPKKSTIKLMKGGYLVVETSKISINRPR